jgi:hypothetical protein
MRERLRSAPLLDHVGFTRSLEAAQRRMWETWAAGGTKAAIDV